jgi:hypothetical protein
MKVRLTRLFKTSALAALALALGLGLTAFAADNPLVVTQLNPRSAIPKTVYTYADTAHKVKISTEYFFIGGNTLTDFFRADGTLKSKLRDYNGGAAGPNTLEEFYGTDGQSVCESINQSDGSKTVVDDMKNGGVYSRRYDSDQNGEYMNVEVKAAGSYAFLYSQTWQNSASGWRLLTAVDKAPDGRDREIVMNDDGKSVAKVEYLDGISPDETGADIGPLDQSHLALLPESALIDCSK